MKRSTIYSVMALTLLALFNMHQSSPLLQADVGAIFDTINRGYFVTTGTHNMTIGSAGSGSFTLIAAGTPVASVSSNGITAASNKSFLPAATSVVAAATPVAGTNQCPGGLCVVPTVAANAAFFLGQATPIPGQSFTIVNTGGNTVRAKAPGAATLNGATAGGYIAVATLTTLDCTTTAAANINCRVPVLPTPAGP